MTVNEWVKVEYKSVEENPNSEAANKILAFLFLIQLEWYTQLKHKNILLQRDVSTFWRENKPSILKIIKNSINCKISSDRGDIRDLQIV